MRERIIGAIAVVVVAIVIVPWLISQVHAPRTLARLSSPPASGTAAAPSANPNPNLYDLPPLNPAGRTAAPAPPPGGSAARASSAGGAQAAPVDKSFYALPPLNSAKSSSSPPASGTAQARTVVTPKPPAASPAGSAAATGWAVQAASFSDRKSAETLAARLEQAGIHVFLSPHVLGSTLYIRVMAGPYADATAARAAAARVTSVSGSRGIVRQLGAGG